VYLSHKNHNNSNTINKQALTSCAACSGTATCPRPLQVETRTATQSISALRSPHMSYSIHLPSLKLVGFPVPKTWLIVDWGFWAWWSPGLIGLMTSTFGLSTSKWGHGSPESWASFLPIFIFLCPSALDLGSCTGQTDKTDNTHQCIMPLQGHNNINVKNLSV